MILSDRTREFRDISFKNTQKLVTALVKDTGLPTTAQDLSLKALVKCGTSGRLQRLVACYLAIVSTVAS